MKLKQLKLNQFSETELKQREMNMFRGGRNGGGKDPYGYGNDCACGCAYGYECIYCDLPPTCICSCWGESFPQVLTPTETHSSHAYHN